MTETDTTDRQLFAHQECTHVYPLNDFREHDTDNGQTCWCKPTIDDDVIVHNAMDQRELIETGERKIQ